MKVKQLVEELILINPNYDVTVKVGDKGERDLITSIHKIKCINSNVDPALGFIELDTHNAIDWRGRK